MTLRVFPAFTGIGSPEMALRNIEINYEIPCISEVDKYALWAYDAIWNGNQEDIKVPDESIILDEIEEKNICYDFYTGKDNTPRSQSKLEKTYIAHKRNNNLGDIRQVNVHNIPDFDLFTYGFPCKDISVAGEQKGLDKETDSQSSLLWECRKVIKEKKPKYLLMENVKNLVGRNHKEDFMKWIDILDNLGYNSYWKVLNGWDYGVPQNRERVIKISKLREHDNTDFQFPEKQKLSKSVEDIMINEPKVQDRLFYDRNRFQHIIESNPKHGLDLSKNKHLYEVGNMDKKSHANSRVYLCEGSSPTLNTMRGGNRQPNILIDDYVRRLEPVECWRLMGYKDKDFYKAKEVGELSDSRLYERSGRGIVVPMLEEIFKNLFGYKNDQ